MTHPRKPRESKYRIVALTLTSYRGEGGQINENTSGFNAAYYNKTQSTQFTMHCPSSYYCFHFFIIDEYMLIYCYIAEQESIMILSGIF